MSTVQAWCSRYAIYRSREASKQTASYPTLLPMIHFVTNEKLSPEELQSAHDVLLAATTAMQTLATFKHDALLLQRDLLLRIINTLYGVEKILPQLETVDKDSYMSMFSHYNAVIEEKEMLLLQVNQALQQRFRVLAPDGKDRVLMKVLWGSVKGSEMWDNASEVFEKNKCLVKSRS